MSKEELVSLIVQRMQCNKTQASAMVDCFRESVTDLIKQHKTYRLPNFGTFIVKKRAARTGKNPKTGEAIKIPDKHYVYFRQGKALKDLFNEEE